MITRQYLNRYKFLSFKLKIDKNCSFVIASFFAYLFEFKSDRIGTDPVRASRNGY